MTILRDKTSAGPPGIDQTGAFKFCKGLLHGVRVDGCFRCEITYRRKLISRLVAAGNDVRLDSFHNL